MCLCYLSFVVNLLCHLCIADNLLWHLFSVLDSCGICRMSLTSYDTFVLILTFYVIWVRFGSSCDISVLFDTLLRTLCTICNSTYLFILLGFLCYLCAMFCLYGTSALYLTSSGTCALHLNSSGTCALNFLCYQSTILNLL